eukprot:snap_masked-scaffold_4-processed-gene-14.16-mRNA-1 protein AED:1.00 eAED:1.00 QI:0/0/0/0/1/1/2/0/2350
MIKRFDETRDQFKFQSLKQQTSTFIIQPKLYSLKFSILNEASEEHLLLNKTLLGFELNDLYKNRDPRFEQLVSALKPLSENLPLILHNLKQIFSLFKDYFEGGIALCRKNVKKLVSTKEFFNTEIVLKLLSMIVIEVIDNFLPFFVAIFPVLMEIIELNEKDIETLGQVFNFIGLCFLQLKIENYKLFDSFLLKLLHSQTDYIARKQPISIYRGISKFFMEYPSTFSYLIFCIIKNVNGKLHTKGKVFLSTFVSVCGENKCARKHFIELGRVLVYLSEYTKNNVKEQLQVFNLFLDSVSSDWLLVTGVNSFFSILETKRSAVLHQNVFRLLTISICKANPSSLSGDTLYELIQSFSLLEKRTSDQYCFKIYSQYIEKCLVSTRRKECLEALLKNKLPRIFRKKRIQEVLASALIEKGDNKELIVELLLDNDIENDSALYLQNEVLVNIIDLTTTSNTDPWKLIAKLGVIQPLFEALKKNKNPMEFCFFISLLDSNSIALEKDQLDYIGSVTKGNYKTFHNQKTLFVSLANILYRHKEGLIQVEDWFTFDDIRSLVSTLVQSFEHFDRAAGLKYMSLMYKDIKHAQFLLNIENLPLEVTAERSLGKLFDQICASVRKLMTNKGEKYYEVVLLTLDTLLGMIFIKFQPLFLHLKKAFLFLNSLLGPSQKKELRDRLRVFYTTAGKVRPNKAEENNLKLLHNSAETVQGFLLELFGENTKLVDDRFILNQFQCNKWFHLFDRDQFVSHAQFLPNYETVESSISKEQSKLFIQFLKFFCKHKLVLKDKSLLLDILLQVVSHPYHNLNIQKTAFEAICFQLKLSFPSKHQRLLLDLFSSNNSKFNEALILVRRLVTIDKQTPLFNSNLHHFYTFFGREISKTKAFDKSTKLVNLRQLILYSLAGRLYCCRIKDKKQRISIVNFLVEFENVGLEKVLETSFIETLVVENNRKLRYTSEGNLKRLSLICSDIVHKYLGLLNEDLLSLLVEFSFYCCLHYDAKQKEVRKAMKNFFAVLDKIFKNKPELILTHNTKIDQVLEKYFHKLKKMVFSKPTKIDPFFRLVCNLATCNIDISKQNILLNLVLLLDEETPTASYDLIVSTLLQLELPQEESRKILLIISNYDNTKKFSSRELFLLKKVMKVDVSSELRDNLVRKLSWQLKQLGNSFDQDFTSKEEELLELLASFSPTVEEVSYILLPEPKANNLTNYDYELCISPFNTFVRSKLHILYEMSGLEDLNAVDKFNKALPDYDVRVQTYNFFLSKIDQMSKQQLTLCTILSLKDIQEEDYGLRTVASQFFINSLRVSQEDVNIYSRHFLIGLRLNSLLHRNHFLKLYRELLLFKSIPVIVETELYCLVDTEEVDLDFFKNISHLQIHRRVRAVKRLQKCIETGILKISPSLWENFIFPLFNFILLYLNKDREETLFIQAFELIKHIVQLDSFEKTCFLKSFKCFINSLELKKYSEGKIAERVNKVCFMLSKVFLNCCAEVEEFESLAFKVSFLLEKNMFGHMQKVKLNRLELYLLFLDKCESQMSSDFKLNKLSKKLISSLQDHLTEVRDNARQALLVIAKHKPTEAVVSRLLTDLKVSLTDGFQRHILGFTVYYLLVGLKDCISTDKSFVLTVLPIVENEVIGFVAEEKDIKYKSKISNFKELHSQSFGHIFQSLAENVGTEQLWKMLLEKLVIMFGNSTDPKVHIKLTTLLNCLNTGITRNAKISQHKRKLYVQDLVSELKKEKSWVHKVHSLYLIHYEIKLWSQAYARKENTEYHDTVQREYLQDLVKNFVKLASSFSSFSEKHLFLKLLILTFQKKLFSDNETVELLDEVVLQVYDILHSLGIKIKTAESSTQLYIMCIKFFRLVLENHLLSSSVSNEISNLLLLLIETNVLAVNESTTQLLVSLFGLLMPLVEPSVEIYNITISLFELLLRSSNIHLQRMVQTVIYNFASSISQTQKKNLLQIVDKLLMNLDYNGPNNQTGRLNALNLLNMILRDHPEILKSKYVEVFMILSLRVQNEKVNHIKQQIKQLFSFLVESVEAHELNQIVQHAITWLDYGSKNDRNKEEEQLLQLGFQISILFAQFPSMPSSLFATLQNKVSALINTLEPDVQLATEIQKTLSFGFEAARALKLLGKEEVLLQLNIAKRKETENELTIICLKNFKEFFLFQKKELELVGEFLSCVVSILKGGDLDVLSDTIVTVFGVVLPNIQHLYIFIEKISSCATSSSLSVQRRLMKYDTIFKIYGQILFYHEENKMVLDLKSVKSMLKVINAQRQWKQHSMPKSMESVSDYEEEIFNMLETMVSSDDLVRISGQLRTQTIEKRKVKKAKKDVEKITNPQRAAKRKLAENKRAATRKKKKKPKD